MDFNLQIDEINYVKIYFQENNNAKVINANVNFIDDDITILYIKKIVKFDIARLQEIKLEFVCNDGLYSSESVVNAISSDNKYNILTIKTPKNACLQQLREFFRVKTNIDVNLKFDNNVYNCISNNISANGICISLKQKIIIPQNVDLEIIFCDRKISTNAIVTRVDDTLVALNFLNMTRNNVDYISKYCIQQQLELKRKMLS